MKTVYMEVSSEVTVKYRYTYRPNTLLYKHLFFFFFGNRY